jgi:hypothetical protein
MPFVILANAAVALYSNTSIDGNDFFTLVVSELAPLASS